VEFRVRSDFIGKLSSYSPAPQNHTAMVRYIPQPRRNQGPDKTAYGNQPNTKKGREVKQHKPGIVVLREESEGEHYEHQNGNTDNDLR